MMDFLMKTFFNNKIRFFSAQQNPDHRFETNSNSFQENSEIGNQGEDLVSNFQENSAFKKTDQENLEQNTIFENNSNFETPLGSDESRHVLSQENPGQNFEKKNPNIPDQNPSLGQNSNFENKSSLHQKKGGGFCTQKNLGSVYFATTET